MSRRTVATILIFCALIMISTIQSAAAQQIQGKTWQIGREHY
jgi:hypothetical protein